MKILILLIFININIVSLSSDPKNDKEYARAERRVKALACTILSNKRSEFKRSLKDLLLKNNIIKRSIEAKEKIPEFLAAICYTKIETYEANQIVDKISKKQLDVLENDYSNLFEIDPKLNFTKIKRIMNRVNKIMNRIIEEEEKLTKEKKENGTYVEEEDFGDKFNIFNITNIIFKIKKLFNNLGFKAVLGICFNFVILIFGIFMLFNKKPEDKNIKDNKSEKNEEEKQDNKKDGNKDDNRDKTKEDNNKTKND